MPVPRPPRQMYQALIGGLSGPAASSVGGGPLLGWAHFLLLDRFSALGGVFPQPRTLRGAWGRHGGPSAADGPFFSGRCSCFPGKAPAVLEVLWEERKYPRPLGGDVGSGVCSPHLDLLVQVQQSSRKLPGPGGCQGLRTGGRRSLYLKGRPRGPMVPLGAGWWRKADMGGVPPGEVQVRPPLHPGCRNSGGLQMAATESGPGLALEMRPPHVYPLVSVLSPWVHVLLAPLCGPDVWVSQPSTVDIGGGINSLSWGLSSLPGLRPSAHQV